MVITLGGLLRVCDCVFVYRHRGRYTRRLELIWEACGEVALSGDGVALCHMHYRVDS